MRQRSGGSRRRRSLDLIPDLGDADGTHFVQHADDISMEGESLGADGDFHVRVCLMHLEQSRMHVVKINWRVVKINEPALGDSDGNVIFGLIWGRGRRVGAGQVHADALHVGLAEADHHEAREEEEHYVDQRDDLDPCVLLRDGRSHFHGFVSSR